MAARGAERLRPRRQTTAARRWRRARRRSKARRHRRVLPGAVYFLMSFIAPTTPSAGVRIVGGDIGKRDRAHPAADARVDGDVLLAVGPEVGDRVADDARRDVELPELGAGARVERLEPAVHRPVEHHVAAGGEHAAVDRETCRPSRPRPCGCARRPTRPARPDSRPGPDTSSRRRRDTACRRCSSPRCPRSPCRCCAPGCRAARCAARTPTG